MFFMHGALFRARQRMYDVPVAADVLVGGDYPRLPKGIQYCGGDIDPRPVFEVNSFVSFKRSASCLVLPIFQSSR